MNHENIKKYAAKLDNFANMMLEKIEQGEPLSKEEMEHVDKLFNDNLPPRSKPPRNRVKVIGVEENPAFKKFDGLVSLMD